MSATAYQWSDTHRLKVARLSSESNNFLKVASGPLGSTLGYENEISNKKATTSINSLDECTLNWDFRWLCLPFILTHEIFDIIIANNFYYLSTLLKDVTIAVVIVARRPRLREHVRYVVRWCIPIERRSTNWRMRFTKNKKKKPNRFIDNKKKDTLSDVIDLIVIHYSRIK